MFACLLCLGLHCIFGFHVNLFRVLLLFVWLVQDLLVLRDLLIALGCFVCVGIGLCMVLGGFAYLVVLGYVCFI